MKTCCESVVNSSDFLVGYCKFRGIGLVESWNWQVRISSTRVLREQSWRKVCRAEPGYDLVSKSFGTLGRIHREKKSKYTLNTLHHGLCSNILFQKLTESLFSLWDRQVRTKLVFIHRPVSLTEILYLLIGTKLSAHYSYLRLDYLVDWGCFSFL